MPFFIFKVRRGATTMERIRTFPEEHLTEAEVYAKAEVYLKRLRRAADPKDDSHFYLAHGVDEAEAKRRLQERLRRRKGS